MVLVRPEIPEVEQTCGAQASVSGVDARVLIAEDGIRESKLAYTAGNLLGAVRTWISVVRLKTTHGPVFDPGRKRKCLHAGRSALLGFSSVPAQESDA